MKTRYLVLTQIWVILFLPAWYFILVFAPLVLTKNPGSWIIFALLVVPFIAAILFSLLMWFAKYKHYERLQKTMVTSLIIIPIIFVIVPLSVDW